MGHENKSHICSFHHQGHSAGHRYGFPMRIASHVKVVNTWLHTEQQRPGAKEDGFNGQLGAKWSVLPQVKQSCLIFIESHVAMSSGSVVDQGWLQVLVETVNRIAARQKVKICG